VQLARLREIFADPLLLPGPRGMQPTARADELRGPLRDALALELAVAPVQPFDPATAAQTWRVAATDYMASAILLPVLNTLRIASPAAAWRCLSYSPRGWYSRRIATKWICFFTRATARRPGCISVCCSANATCWRAGPGIRRCGRR
jgi:DNA-binding transcriptional LysR family regulator